MATRKKSKKLGRPTKYNSAFHPEEYIKLSRHGNTRIQIADKWDVTRDTILNWEKRNKDFAEACKMGRQALEAWYTNFTLNIAAGKMSGNITALIWLTKNCLGWKDKQEIQHTIDDIDFEDEND